MADLITRVALELASYRAVDYWFATEEDYEKARAVVGTVLEDVSGEIIKHSDVARKKMSECYEQGNPEGLGVWSSIVAHLDTAQEKSVHWENKT